MTERIRPRRGPPILWLAVVCEVGVVLSNLRSQNYWFAAHAVALACLLAMIAWHGEPARGTGLAKVMWGLFVVCGIFLGVAALGPPG